MQKTDFAQKTESGENLNMVRRTLRVAAMHAPVITLGPFKRCVIWTQGCCFDCPECISPQWRSMEGGTVVNVKELAEEICRLNEIEGLTISGGEPMLQASSLVHLVQLVKQKKTIGIICYTGFDWKDLEHGPDQNRIKLVSLCDVLIDGPYVSHLNDNKGLRGSSNQKIQFITPRYAGMMNEFLEEHRKIQLIFENDQLLAAGVPPRGLAGDLQELVRGEKNGCQG